jgi:hypothetical protein
MIPTPVGEDLNFHMTDQHVYSGGNLNGADRLAFAEFGVGGEAEGF